MNVLVTGCKGFIGQHVVRCLIGHGQKVLCPDGRLDVPISSSYQKAIQNVDAVIHLAAKNRASDDDIFRANVLGTLSLLDAIKENNPNAHIVFASSFQVYYGSSFFGATKKTGEDMCQAYTKRFGIKSTVLRLSNVYGPGCRPDYNSVIATYIHHALLGMPVHRNGDGSQKRDYIFVDDVARAFVAALGISDNVKNFQTFNICSGKQVALNGIIEFIGSVTRKKIVIQTTNLPEPSSLPVFKPIKAKNVLHWKPNISLEEGIQRILCDDYGYHCQKT